MPLKTVVKVGNISNLSDARYCAGMGVDMLGFRVIEGQDHYISPKLYQEIRGWVSGPKVVAEVYGLANSDQLRSVLENYLPDYIELSEDEFRRFKREISLPCIVKGTPNGDKQVAYFLLDEGTFHSGKILSPTLVQISSPLEIDNILKNHDVSGFALNGSPEIRPGYKDYSDLSEILEKLESE